MKKGLQKRFGLIRDTREVEVPFAPGIFFTLRRPSHPAIVEWNEQQQRESPLVTRFFSEMQKEQAKLALSGRGGKVDRAAIAERVFSRDDLQTDTIANLSKIGLERTANFVENWRNMDDGEGHEIPFSRDELFDLLAAPEFLPEDQPYAFEEPDPEKPEEKPARRTLGAALVAWIADEVEHEERWIEALAKNSEASSAGVSATSAN